MGLIVKRLRVAGDKGERRLEVLFDTGAGASFIRRDVVERIATTLELPSYTLGDGVGRLRVNGSRFPITSSCLRDSQMR